LLPRWQRAWSRSDADAERTRRFDLRRRERSKLLDHGPDRELAGARARGRTVAVHEEELVDSIGRGRQEITAEAEKIPIAGVETCNRATSHALHFMSYRDA
jgi:hypothetical protein